MVVATIQRQSNVGELKRLLALKETDRRCNPLKYYEPASDKHDRFHRSNAKISALFGGNKSGKSTTLVVQCLRAAENKDPYRQWKIPNIGRFNGGDFEHSIDEVLKPLFLRFCSKNINGKPNIRIKHNPRGFMNELVFHNGSRIEFMSYKQDPMLHEGVNRDWIAFDEPPPKEIFNASKGRVMEHRGPMYMAMTLLDEPWIVEDIYEQNDGKTIFCEIVTVYDRHDISEQEKQEIVTDMCVGLDEDTKRVRIYGDFAATHGRVYHNYKNVAPWVCEPFKIPDDWQIIECIDPHEGKPTAVVWLAVDHRNEKIYIVAELYDSSLRSIPQIASAIRKKRESGMFKYLHETNSYTVIDPSIDAGGKLGGINYRNEFSRCDIRTGKITRPDVDASVKRVFELLTVSMDNKPKIITFSDCTRTRYEWMHYFREVTGQIRKTNDDCMDAIRYGICTVPIGSSRPIIKRIRVA